ncbi:MAG: beta strand repeat-containing protein [Phycisphaerales bacterium]
MSTVISMSNRRNRLASAGALILAAGAAVAANASIWINPLGGAWTVPANWDDGMVPNAPGATATIGTPGAYIVDLGSSTSIALGTLELTNPDATVLIGIASLLDLQSGTHTIDGELRIGDFSSSSSNSILRATGDVTLAGTGVTRLADNISDDAQLSAAAASQYFFAPEHTVAGTGIVPAPFTNNGLVTADAEGFSLRLRVADRVNNAVMRAVDGGILAFEFGTTAQGVDGLILASGAGSRVEFSTGFGQAVLGGTLRSEGGADPITRSSSGTTTLEAVTLEGAFFIDFASSVVITGGSLVNDAAVSIGNFSASASDSIMSFQDSVLVTGSGELRLADGVSNDAQINGVLTSSAGHTIAGAGQLNAALTNNGLVSADVAGETMDLRLEDKINNATMRATNGATLSIESITIDQTGGGQILADGAGSLVEFPVVTASTIIGGQLNATPDAPAYIRRSGSTTLVDVTLNADMVIDIGGSVFVQGTTMTNNGRIEVGLFSASASNSIIDFMDPILLTGTGEIALSDDVSDDAQLNGTVTNDALHTISGTGRINAALTNDGLVSADLADQTLELGSQNKVNNSTIRATNQGIISIESITIDQTGGGQILADGANARIVFPVVTSSTIIGGSIDATPDAPPVRRLSGATTLDGVDLNADMIIDLGGSIEYIGTNLNNSGRIDIGLFSPSASNSIMSFADAATLTGGGEIALQDPASDDAQLNASNGLTNGSGHTISGVGIINADLVNEGTIAPGAPSGTLDLNGTYTEGATAQFHASIDAFGDTGVLAVSGAASVNGDITLEIDPGFLPEVGEQFDILTADTVSGTMEVVSAPTIAGLVFTAITLEDRVVISVSVCADLNDDDIVNSDDLGLLLGNFGCAKGCTADINGDGLVDSDDLGLLLGGFGADCQLGR